MNDTLIIPSPEVLPLPAPASLLHGLLLLTFLLHLLFMNGLVGGAVIALWSRLRSRTADDLHSDLATRIGKLLPTLMAATVTFGVAPLLFLQALYGRYFFTSSILIGWSWFAVVPLLLLGYYGTYLEAFRGHRLAGWRPPLLAAVVLVLVAVGFIYTNNATLMLRPASWPAIYFADPSGLNWNLQDPQVIPRWLHMMLAAVAVGGLMLALWGAQRQRRGSEPLGSLMRELGLVLLGYATMANFAVGLWFLMALERSVMLDFMGGSPHATGLLGVGFVLALALIALAMRTKSKPAASLKPVTIVAVITLIVMVLMRDFVRSATLAQHGAAPTTIVATQVGNVVVFGVLLVATLATVWWMLNRLWRATGE